MFYDVEVPTSNEYIAKIYSDCELELDATIRNFRIVQTEGSRQDIVKNILENNPQSVTDFKNGKGKTVGFLAGQAMKKTKGKANLSFLIKLLVKNFKRCN